MSGHSNDSMRIDDVLIASTFVVTPSDLAEYREHCFMGGVPLEPGEAFRGLQMAAVFPSHRRACPVAILVRRAVESVTGAVPRPGAVDVIVRDVSRVRQLSAAVLGESITPVASVRYRSRARGASHITLDVNLRRRSGTVLARFRLGIELSTMPRSTGEFAAVNVDAA